MIIKFTYKNKGPTITKTKEKMSKVEFDALSKLDTIFINLPRVIFS